MTTRSPSIRSASARTGVIPIPPATSSSFGPRRNDSVNVPNGPSATTRVPTGIVPILEVWSPEALTLIRSDLPSGAAESENGWAVYQNPRVTNRQRKNCPGRACSLSSPRPVMWIVVTVGDSAVTSATRRL